MKIFAIAALSAASILAGCASVAVTNDSIEQRTSVALGMDQSKFSISDRVNEGIKTTYAVKTLSGKTYSCYVTGTVSYMGRVVSDAICSEMGKGTKPLAKQADPSCNALLHAAGKC
jgi:hypothetical protein